jgi:hypothetical protein
VFIGAEGFKYFREYRLVLWFRIDSGIMIPAYYAVRTMSKGGRGVGETGLTRSRATRHERAAEIGSSRPSRRSGDARMVDAIGNSLAIRSRLVLPALR